MRREICVRKINATRNRLQLVGGRDPGIRRELSKYYQYFPTIFSGRTVVLLDKNKLFNLLVTFLQAVLGQLFTYWKFNFINEE